MTSRALRLETVNFAADGPHAMHQGPTWRGATFLGQVAQVSLRLHALPSPWDFAVVDGEGLEELSVDISRACIDELDEPLVRPAATPCPEVEKGRRSSELRTTRRIVRPSPHVRTYPCPPELICTLEALETLVWRRG